MKKKELKKQFMVVGTIDVHYDDVTEMTTEELFMALDDPQKKSVMKILRDELERRIYMLEDEVDALESYKTELIQETAEVTMEKVFLEQIDSIAKKYVVLKFPSLVSPKIDVTITVSSADGNAD